MGRCGKACALKIVNETTGRMGLVGWVGVGLFVVPNHSVPALYVLVPICRLRTDPEPLPRCRPGVDSDIQWSEVAEAVQRRFAAPVRNRGSDSL